MIIIVTMCKYQRSEHVRVRGHHIHEGLTNSVQTLEGDIFIGGSARLVQHLLPRQEVETAFDIPHRHTATAIIIYRGKHQHS